MRSASTDAARPYARNGNSSRSVQGVDLAAVLKIRRDELVQRLQDEEKPEERAILTALLETDGEIDEGWVAMIIDTSVSDHVSHEIKELRKRRRLASKPQPLRQAQRERPERGTP